MLIELKNTFRILEIKIRTGETDFHRRRWATRTFSRQYASTIQEAGRCRYCCEEEAPDIIRRHILRNKILRADVDKYIENFPLKTYKYIYDLRLYDVFAWR